jgi:tetrapyrrole methylase family protein/MazG family protein
VVVVGLGPGEPDLLTVAAAEAIARHPARYLRTRVHPGAAAMAGAESFDDIYDTATRIEDVYDSMASSLATAAQRHGTVVFGVPGSPLVAERSVQLLLARDDVDVDIVDGLSFAELAWSRLGVDPVMTGARLIDGHRFVDQAAGSRGALLVAQCDRAEVLEEVKLALGEVVDRPGGDPGVEVVVLRALGTPEEDVVTVAWDVLDRVEPDHLTTVWVPPLAVPLAGAAGTEVDRLGELMGILRSTCPWDRRQTHGSLRPHLLEEAYEVLEVLDTVASAEAGGGEVTPDVWDALAEELGDLLFQVVFHSALAAEAGRFDLADVAAGIHDKLHVRHPHVFGDAEVEDVDALRQAWESAKVAEKGRSSVFDGIPAGLPALAQAAKVMRKAQSLPGAPGLAPAGQAVDPDGLDGELVGELLLGVVVAAGAVGVDPEAALREAVARQVVALRAFERQGGAGPPAPGG